MKPWVEEYHPKKLKHLVGNVDIIKKMRHMVDDNELQNLIITGFSGCGKSSSIFAIIRELGAEFIELNASDERNISTIRSTIKSFAMKKSFSTKIIVLEEIDNMPKGSQHGIVSLMEEAPTTHFILTCNDYNKIVENLTSRCMILKFKTISEQDIIKRLSKICRDKKINYEDQVLDIIAYRAEGDLRKAINLLQTLYFYDSSYLSLCNLHICSTIPSKEVVQNIILSSIKQNIKQSFHELEYLLNQGYDYSDIISFLFKECSNMNLQDYNKIEYLKCIGDHHRIILSGGEKIQLYSLIIQLSKIDISA